MAEAPQDLAAEKIRALKIDAKEFKDLTNLNVDETCANLI